MPEEIAFAPKTAMARDLIAAAHLAVGLSADAWATLATGEGTKGLRLYDWGRVRLGPYPPVRP